MRSNASTAASASRCSSKGPSSTIREQEPSYPEVRWNALTGDRVIVAPGRRVRPQPDRLQWARAKLPAFDPDCPFCPGNESETPLEVYRVPADAEPGGGWKVRVVRNKYPALAAPGELAGASLAGPSWFERSEPAVGRHEVIIETPDHDRDILEFGGPEIQSVMQTCRARYADAAADERIRHILIFRNCGPLANASLPHPHSQFVGLPFVPPQTSAMLERAVAHRRLRGRSLLADLVEGEVQGGARLVEMTERLATFVPYAPSNEFETWIAPRTELPGFEAVDDDTLVELGRALQRALAAQAAALGEPDYNVVFRFPPLGREGARTLGWYVQLVPRITVTAGFELGLGVHILVTTPEDAADRLRQGLAKLAGV